MISSVNHIESQDPKVLEKLAIELVRIAMELEELKDSLKEFGKINLENTKRINQIR